MVERFAFLSVGMSAAAGVSRRPARAARFQECLPLRRDFGWSFAPQQSRFLPTAGLASVL